MSLLAGESVGQTRRLMSAAGIVEEIISGAEAVIRTRLGSMVVDAPSVDAPGVDAPRLDNSSYLLSHIL